MFAAPAAVLRNYRSVCLKRVKRLDAPQSIQSQLKGLNAQILATFDI